MIVIDPPVFLSAWGARREPARVRRRGEPTGPAAIFFEISPFSAPAGNVRSLKATFFYDLCRFQRPQTKIFVAFNDFKHLSRSGSNVFHSTEIRR
jgi:hypothetical protein